MSASSGYPSPPGRPGRKRRAAQRPEFAPQAVSPDEAQRLRSLLQCLRAHGVPNRLAIPLLMRLRGECYSAAAFIQWQGISRQYLTLLLSDARAPSQAMRSALALYLGVDPFAPVVPAKVDCAGDCR